MAHKKPEPVIERRTRPLCPVCGETSYSLAGIHPQCVMRQADAKRLGRLKQEPQEGVTQDPASLAKPWQKVCPKCRTLQHVRKKVCDCGYALHGSPDRKPSSEEGQS